MQLVCHPGEYFLSCLVYLTHVDFQLINLLANQEKGQTLAQL